MTKLRSLALLLAVPLAASAADPALLQMVMPDANVIAGLQVDQARNSLFGQYMLSHLQADNSGVEQFASQTGFDPRTDLSEIVMASAAQTPGPNNPGLIIARGTFNIARITATAQAGGFTPGAYQGVNLLTHTSPAQPQRQSAFAFFDASTAVMGDLASVKAAIDRHNSNAPAGGPLMSKAIDVSAKNDFWFVTSLPLSQFSANVPDRNVSGAFKSNAIAGITQASGGVRFGDTVTISTEAIARSDKDAQALVDVVRFFAGLAQLNRQSNRAAGQVATLLDGLNTQASGNVTTISLAIPEQQLEQVLQSVQPQGQAHHRAATRLN